MAQDIWTLIKQHEGEMFSTVTGKEFTYQIKGNTLYHTRTATGIPKSAFEKAVALNPGKPSDLQNVIVGPSYVYAIITDKRMR